jgi:DNA polymerase III delta prime subunit
MFENIIGHAEVLAGLRAELAQGTFPRAALFFGPAYAGKLSTALETARVLTCSAGSAEWSCDCSSCRMQKELSHPNTVLLGPRYADIEIAACADALVRARKPATVYLFLRAVRKLTRRFDPAVMDLEDTRAKGAPDKVARLEELAAEIAPGRDLPDEQALRDLLDRIIAAAAPLAAQIRGDSISIDQVRRLGTWAHMTAAGARKVAIIENADRMQDSARNGLLKLLEEPPAAVHLMLISTRRAAIIPTILSRLRPYHFAERAEPQDREVMEKIFRQEAASHDNLRSFFLAWKEINPEKLSSLAERFLEMAVDPSVSGVDAMSEMTELLPERRGQKDRSARETVVSFLEELTFRFSSSLRTGRLSHELLSRWNESVREALLRLETFNMNPSEVLESLYYGMRAAADQSGASAPSGSMDEAVPR